MCINSKKAVNDLQGMGWTCLEELVWGDKEHKWVKPGVLHTRGPGMLLLFLHSCWSVSKVLLAKYRHQLVIFSSQVHEPGQGKLWPS